MRNKLRIVLLILMTAVMLASCLPKEYRDGVKLDRDYPEDELPLYDDDMVVYECEDDKDEITVLYGTEDDIDDVVDFYQDFFEDENITVQEDDDRDRYRAKGRIDNFVFKIDVQEAEDNPEKRAFKTIVEVEIEFFDDVEQSADTQTSTNNTQDNEQQTAEATPTPEPAETDSNSDEKLLDKLQGLWVLLDVDGKDYREDGIAYEFKGDTLVYYGYFEVSPPDEKVTIIDEDSFEYTFDDEIMERDVEFQTRDGKEYMILKYKDRAGDDSVATLIKSAKADFVSGTLPEDTPAGNTGSNNTNNNQTTDDNAIMDGDIDFDWDTFDWEIVLIDPNYMSDNYLREAIVGTWQMVDNNWDHMIGVTGYVLIDTYYEDGTYEFTWHYTYEDGGTFSGEGSGTWSINNQVLTISDSYSWIVVGPDYSNSGSDSTSSYSCYVEAGRNPDYLYTLSGDGYSISFEPYEP